MMSSRQSREGFALPGFLCLVVISLALTTSVRVSGQCVVDQIIVRGSLGHRSLSDFSLDVSGECPGNSLQPMFDRYSKNGRVARVIFSEPSNVTGTPTSPWGESLRIGRLPPGENTIEVYFQKGQSEPVLMRSQSALVASPGQCAGARAPGATLLFP